MTDVDKFKGLYLREQITNLEMMLAAAKGAYQGHANEVVARMIPDAKPTDDIRIDFGAGEVTVASGDTADSQSAK